MSAFQALTSSEQCYLMIKCMPLACLLLFGKCYAYLNACHFTFHMDQQYFWLQEGQATNLLLYQMFQLVGTVKSLNLVYKMALKFKE